MLRESEEFMIDVEGLWNHNGKGREGPLAHVVIPLMDRFKGGLGADITYKSS